MPTISDTSDDKGWLQDNDPDEPGTETNFDVDGANLIRQVPLTLDGSVFANIYSLGEDIDLTSGLDLQPLFEAIGFDPRSDAEQFAEDDAKFKPLPPGWARDKKWRGPYYGRDQLFDKLKGMKGAWMYIDVIYVDDTDITDVYYVVFSS